VRLNWLVSILERSARNNEWNRQAREVYQAIDMPKHIDLADAMLTDLPRQDGQ
jgi:hypothetical protein